MWIYFGCLLLVVLASFHAGRRLGIRQGRGEMAAKIPLALREQALTGGRCPVCDAEHDRGTMCQEG